MNTYRTHTCNELKISNENQAVKLSGWIHSKRDHGSLIFIDLRDSFGITQCVVDKEGSNQGTSLRQVLTQMVRISTARSLMRSPSMGVSLNLSSRQISGS